MRVVWAILDWGIGHLTRSFAFIKREFSNAENIIIAPESFHKWLSKRLEYEPVTIPPLNIDYQLGPVGSTIVNIPILTVRKAFFHHLAQILTKRVKPNLIISDNCYGFHTPRVQSVIITHQINISVYGYPLAEQIIKKELSFFDEIWIPDLPEFPGLAGILSHKSGLSRVRYIGPLSRFSQCKEEKHGDFGLVLTSGPPSARQSIAIVGSRWLLKRGIRPVIVGHSVKGIESIKDPYDKTLKKAICQAQIVIARAGYSTIMDLWNLRKKAILVPTPGQPEQEYLAKHVSKHFKQFLYKTELQLIKEVQ